MTADQTTRVSSIPLWPGFLSPVLVALSDGKVWRKRDLESAVILAAALSDEELAERLGQGDSRALNRIGWAFSALTRAQAVAKPARAEFQITETGRALLSANADGISEAHLKEVPAYQEYLPTKGRSVVYSDPVDSEVDSDPTEQIEAGVAKLENDLAAQLLLRLHALPPLFFEQTVLALLRAMGYGGAEARVSHLGGSGDGGFDGVIDQDALGLSRVYVQAKRYGPGNSVQRPDVQGFVGALAGQGATQGVFMTTSTFSSGARVYAEQVPSRIVLVDGSRLAELLIQYRVGVQVRKSYDIVEVDEDYFE